jgi:hypothetical protein
VFRVHDNPHDTGRAESNSPSTAIAHSLAFERNIHSSGGESDEGTIPPSYRLKPANWNQSKPTASSPERVYRPTEASNPSTFFGTSMERDAPHSTLAHGASSSHARSTGGVSDKLYKDFLSFQPGNTQAHRSSEAEASGQ